MKFALDAILSREVLTWSIIFSMATLSVGLSYWMGAASHAGGPLSLVAAIGLVSSALMGAAAVLAVKFSNWQ